MQINSTQLAGLVAFISAFLAAASALVSGGRYRRDWLVVATFYALSAIEVVAKFRHRLSSAMRAWLQMEKLYPERRPAQSVVLLFLVIIAMLVARHLVSEAPTRSLAFARGASAALLTLFLIELISLHASDAILYHAAGSVLLIGWLWFACGAITVVAALSNSRPLGTP